MRVMTRFHFVPFATGMALTLCAAMSAYAQTATQPEADSGSEEAVAKSAITFTDKVTGVNVTLFEAVTNKISEQRQECDKLRYYVSPLFYFQLDRELPVPSKTTDNQYYLYPVSVLFFHDRMVEQALNKIGRRGECEPKQHQISWMSPKRAVTFSLTDHGAFGISSIGSGTTSVSLGARGSVNIKVPLEMQQSFEESVKAGTLSYEALIYYNTKSLIQFYVQWSVDDLMETEAYKKIDQGGGNYFSADQVQNVMRQAASKAGLFQYSDQGAERKFAQSLESIFDTFLSKTTERDVTDKQIAMGIDADLRQGAGLTSEDFKPLTLLWDMAEAIRTVDNKEEANKALDDFSKQNKESIRASAGYSDGLFSVGGSGSKETSTAVHKRFETTDQFQKFKEAFVQGSGKDAKVVMRGLKLLDKSTFKNHLSLMVSQYSVSPINGITPFTVRGTIKLNSTQVQEHITQRLQELDNRITTMDDRLVKLSANDIALHDKFSTLTALNSVPIGTIMAWHKNLPNTPSLKLGWAECNGQVLSDPQSPYHGQTLPNLNGEGRFLRGSNLSGTLQEMDWKSFSIRSTPNHAPAQQNLLVPKNGWAGQGVYGSVFGVAGPHGINDMNFMFDDSEVRPKNMSVVWIIKVK